MPGLQSLGVRDVSLANFHPSPQSKRRVPTNLQEPTVQPSTLDRDSKSPSMQHVILLIVAKTDASSVRAVEQPSTKTLLLT